MKALVMSLDCAMLDTVNGIEAAMNSSLGELGIKKKNRPFYAKTVHLDLADILKQAFESAYSPNGHQRAYQRFQDIYRFGFLNGTKVQQGVYEIFEALLKSGVPALVVANKPGWYLDAILGNYFPKWPFAFAGGIREGEAYEGLLLRALSKTGISPGEALFITDSPAEALAAGKKGLDSYGALWGTASKKDFERSGVMATMPKPHSAISIMGF